MIDLMFITNDPGEAYDAVEAKVGRIFIDLETLGKKERQNNRDTYISNHDIKDIDIVKNRIGNFPLMVRTNPINEKSKSEIEECIARGADILMLPMFRNSDEVKRFLDAINGRAKVCLLLETPQALCRINEILEIEGIDELHVGINDLHIGMQLDFMFEIVSGGLIDYISHIVHQHNITFGFGGVAKIGQGIVPAEVVLGEHYRVGSEMVILSRSFRRGTRNDIKEEVLKIKNEEQRISCWTKEEYDINHKKLDSIVRSYIRSKSV